ncbi:MAG: ABC transporter ATP-binding protein [Anaerolineales bacterium]|nr:ABC transporter ATP-binding protein [Anaerolineales bacterium]
MQGEVFGFLGPNGAGKTTSMKMLLGLIEPTSGSAFLLGKPIGNRKVMSQVGFLPEHFRFQEWLTAAEFLLLNGQLLKMTKKNLKQRMNELLERVGLSDFRDKQLRTFSKGMLQRIGLAQALLNRPALVFLDEPTSGLDPVGRRLVRDVIHEVRAQGTSVFLNSHLLSEIEVTCDRVAFIRHGEVARILDLSSLSADQTSVTIRVANFSAESLGGLSQWGKDMQLDGEFIHMIIPSDSVLPEITRYLVAQHAEVYAITPNRMSLEDIFIETVGKDGGL